MVLPDSGDLVGEGVVEHGHSFASSQNVKEGESAVAFPFLISDMAG
jgi:hypothetical protein